MDLSLSENDPQTTPFRVPRRRVSVDDANVFDRAASTFELLVTGPDPLAIDGREIPGLPPCQLVLDELGALLLAADTTQATRDAAWAHLITLARAEGGRWTVACTGLALPVLVPVALDLTRRFLGDRHDIFAAVLEGFLRGLNEVDLVSSDLLVKLRWAAFRRGMAAVREALDSPPLQADPRHESHAPPPPSGHPDLVLADAVAAGVLDSEDAELISATRVGETSLDEVARARGQSYETTKQTRRRAETRLVAYLAEHDIQNPPATNRAVAEYRPTPRGLPTATRTPNEPSTPPATTPASTPATTAVAGASAAAQPPNSLVGHRAGRGRVIRWVIPPPRTEAPAQSSVSDLAGRPVLECGLLRRLRLRNVTRRNPDLAKKLRHALSQNGPKTGVRGCGARLSVAQGAQHQAALGIGATAGAAAGAPSGTGTRSPVPRPRRCLVRRRAGVRLVPSRPRLRPDSDGRWNRRPGGRRPHARLVPSRPPRYGLGARLRTVSNPPPRRRPAGGRVRARRRARCLLLTALLVAVAVLVGSSVAWPETVHVVALARTVNDVLNNIRNWIMGILALVTVVFVTIGGLRYLLASGDPGEVEKAKGAFRAAGIGFVLAALAPVVVEVLKGIVGGV